MNYKPIYDYKNNPIGYIRKVGVKYEIKFITPAYSNINPQYIFDHNVYIYQDTFEDAEKKVNRIRVAHYMQN